jgi:DNA-binding NarL/FixJ family response regulator
VLPLREFRPPSQIGASVGVSQRVSPSSQISRQRGGGNIRAHARSTPGMDTTQKSALQISVFIVSDVRVHREGLAALLRDCPSIKVMGAHNLRDSQHALHSTALDVALIDGALSIESDTIGALRKTCAPVRIARRLGVQPCTAKNHVRNILQKLKVHRRGEAVAKLNGLLGGRFPAG